MTFSLHPPTMEEVYSEYFSTVYNYVFYRLLNRENTEDIVSQVFLKVLRHLSSFDPARASMKTWLLRIADHTLIDFYRRQKPLLSYSQSENGLENILNIQFDDQYEQIMEPKRRELLSALRELPERDRLFIYYKYFLNITNREIARHMNMNENTVSAIMARARNKLKNILTDEA